MVDYLPSELTVQNIKENVLTTKNLIMELSNIASDLKEIVSEIREITHALNTFVSNLGIFVDNSIVTDRRFLKYAEMGYAFHFIERFENIANNGTATVYFKNPENSGHLVYLVGIEISTLAQLYINAYRFPTITSPGTNLLKLNLRFDAPRESIVIAQKNVTFTGTPTARMVVPGGQKQSALGALSALGEGLILQPNTHLLIEFVNTSGATTSFSVRYLWFEVQL